MGRAAAGRWSRGCSTGARPVPRAPTAAAGPCRPAARGPGQGQADERSSAQRGGSVPVATASGDGLAPASGRRGAKCSPGVSLRPPERWMTRRVRLRAWKCYTISRKFTRSAGSSRGRMSGLTAGAWRALRSDWHGRCSRSCRCRRRAIGLTSQRGSCRGSRPRRLEHAPSPVPHLILVMLAGRGLRPGTRPSRGSDRPVEGRCRQIVRVLEDAGLRVGAQAAERRSYPKEAEGLTSPRPPSALGRHWQGPTRTGRVHSALHRSDRARYISKIERYSGERIAYAGESVTATAPCGRGS
jgi:hypothetical protein